MEPRPGDTAPMALMQLVEGEARQAAGRPRTSRRRKRQGRRAEEGEGAGEEGCAKADKAEAAPKRRKKAAA